jgi:hypothetical protein
MARRKTKTIYESQRKSFLKRYVNSIKEAFPCADCGKYYPYYVMDFDHVIKGKVNDVNYMIKARYSIDSVMDELAKCEIVCANCHRIRTYDRTV